MKLSFALCALTLCAATGALAAPISAPSQQPIARGYTSVSGVSISFERTKYKPGETASGTVTLSGEGTDAKPVTVSGGVSPATFSLAPGESQGVSVKLSATPGDYKFTAKSEGKSSTATLTVVSKTWNVGKAIEGGELTGKETVDVGPGGAVGVGVKDARDEDEWVYDVGDEQLNEKGTEADEIKSYKWTCSGGGFYKGNNPDGTPRLEATADGQGATWWAWMSPGTATLTCTIEDKPKAVPKSEGGTRDDSALTRTVTVTVLPVQLVVRRMKAPEDAEEREFATSAIIAAGGKDSPEQKADVQIVHDEKPVTVSVGRVIISDGEKGEDGVNAKLSMNGSTGEFTSHNVVEAMVTLKLEAGPGSQEAKVHQFWGDQFDFSVPPIFEYGSSKPLSFTPYIGDGSQVKVKKQSVEFSASRIVFYAWSKADHDFVAYTLTPGMSGQVNKAAWQKLSGLVGFSPAIASSDSGDYKTNFNIQYDPKRMIDEVEFKATGYDLRK